MQEGSVIIIGAGAAGLMTARILAKARKHVQVLEARDRCGGRIRTLINEQGFNQVELGAEFIHGDLPVTLQLLDEANIAYYPAGAEVWRFKNGRFVTDDDSFPNWDELMEKLQQLEADCTIHDFLQREFAEDKYTDLRKAVERFASGYDTAEPKKVSAFALRSEWEHEGVDPQHRVGGGYISMVDYLAKEAKAHNAEIHLNTSVVAINWKSNHVLVVAEDGREFTAEKLLIALPLGVLHVDTIKFDPPIPDHHTALNQIGFGAIIKVLLEFNSPFWEDEYSGKLAGRSMKEMGFIISEEAVPTWWTQEPLSTPILTGWLGGPPAMKRKGLSADQLLELSLQSVSTIFSREVSWLKDNLEASSIQNWTNEPYTLGSYAYDIVGSSDARKVLSNPIEQTIYFAGEYLYDGTAMGTVEAALTSGKNAAASILS